MALIDTEQYSGALSEGSSFSGTICAGSADELVGSENDVLATSEYDSIVGITGIQEVTATLNAGTDYNGTITA